MKTRLIIEDGDRRYEVRDLKVCVRGDDPKAPVATLECNDTLFCVSIREMAAADAREAEIAELKRKVALAYAFTGWVGLNAERELWQNVRDKACEIEFRMNHPETEEVKA